MTSFFPALGTPRALLPVYRRVLHFFTSFCFLVCAHCFLSPPNPTQHVRGLMRLPESARALLYSCAFYRTSEYGALTHYRIILSEPSFWLVAASTNALEQPLLFCVLILFFSEKVTSVSPNLTCGACFFFLLSSCLFIPQLLLIWHSSIILALCESVSMARKLGAGFGWLVAKI